MAVVIYHSTTVHLVGSRSLDASNMGVVDWLLSATKWFRLGVPMFFVISGFCIAAAADGVRYSKLGVGQYLVRRFRRIYPPLWIVIVGHIGFFLTIDVLLFPGLVSEGPWPHPRPWWYNGWQWIGNVSLTESWLYHVVGGARSYMPPQAWTLCYEEQFYLVTGILLVITRKYFFLAAVVVSAATCLAMYVGGFACESIDGFFFDGKWLMFAAGIAVYFGLRHAGTRGRWACAGLLGLACVTSVIVLPEKGAVEYGFSFGFAILLLGAHRWDSFVTSCRLSRPLLYCGTMCYSLYLIHQLPVRAISYGFYEMGMRSAEATVFVALPVCVGVSLVLGRVFYWAVERRFLNASPRWGSDVVTGSPARSCRDAVTFVTGGSRQLGELVDPAPVVDSICNPIVASK